MVNDEHYYYMDCIEQSLMPHSTQYRSFWRQSLQ